MTGYANEIYGCRVCSKTFPRYVALRRHLLTQHSTGQLYSCEYCNRRFSQKCNMQRHSRMHTGEKPYTCTVCSKGFTQKGNLERHMAIHTGNRPYACNFCDKTFAQSGNLKTHLLRHTGDRPFKCHLCDKAFAVKGNLQTHLLRHTNDQCYICDVCNEGFLAENEYTQHMLTHDREQVHSCEVCLEQFESEVQMNVHMSIHGSREASNKKLSSRTLAAVDDLHQHTKKVKVKYVCDICKEGFLEKNQFIHHMLTHEQQREYNSKFSNEKLKKKDRMNDPFAPEAPHVCVACGKKFTKKYNLNRHLQTHTDNKYVCNVCGDKFNHQSNFKRHLAVHGTNKPYMCNLCPRGFLQKSNLKRHLSTHGNVHLEEHEEDVSGNVYIVKEEDGLILNEGLYLVNDEYAQSSNIDDYVETKYDNDSPSDVMYVKTREDNQSAGNNVKVAELELAPNNEPKINPHGSKQSFINEVVHGDNLSPSNQILRNVHEDGQTPRDDVLYNDTTNESELSQSESIVYIKAHESDMSAGIEVYVQYDDHLSSSDDICITNKDDKLMCQSPSNNASVKDPESDNSYMCDQCGEAFTEHYLLEQHFLTHSDNPIIVVVV